MDVANLRLGVDSSPLISGMRSLVDFRTKAQQAEAATVSFGKMSTAAFAGIAAAATGALAGLFSMGSAISKARAMSSALAEVSTLIEGTPEQMGKLEKAALRLTAAYGGPAEGKVKAFYQAISAGAESVEKAIEITEQANRLAIGGVTTVEVGVDGLTSVMNAYKQQALGAAEVSDAFFIAMKGGKTTVGELAASIGRVAPFAQGAGIGFDELAAALSATTASGIGTNEAVSGMKQVIANIIRPTEQATKAATDMTLAFDGQALRSKGLNTFLDEVVEKTGGSTDKMVELFGSIEALNVVLALTSNDGAKFNEILEQMRTKAGATDEAYSKMALNMDQRLIEVMGRFGTHSLALGNVLLTVLVPVMETVADVADAISGAVSASLGFLDSMGVSATAAGYGLGILATVMTVRLSASIIMAVGRSVLMVGTNLGIMGTMATAAAGGVTILGGAFRLLRSALITSSIGALILGAGMLVDWLVRLREETGSWSAAFTEAGARIGYVWDFIWYKGEEFYAWFRAESLRAVGSFIKAFQDLGPGTEKALEELKTTTLKAVGDIIVYFSQMGSRSAAYVSKMVDDMVAFVSALPERTAAAVKDFWTSLSEPELDEATIAESASYVADKTVELMRLALLRSQGKPLPAGVDFFKVKEMQQQMEADAVAAGQNFVASISNAIRGGSSEVNAAASSLVQAALGPLQNIDTSSAGENVAWGFIAGMKSRIGEIKDAALELAATVKSSIADALQIESPSKVTRKLGENTAEGFVDGFADATYTDLIDQAIRAWEDKMTTAGANAADAWSKATAPISDVADVIENSGDAAAIAAKQVADLEKSINDGTTSTNKAVKAATKFGDTIKDADRNAKDFSKTVGGELSDSMTTFASLAETQLGTLSQALTGQLGSGLDGFFEASLKNFQNWLGQMIQQALQNPIPIIGQTSIVGGARGAQLGGQGGQGLFGGLWGSKGSPGSFGGTGFLGLGGGKGFLGLGSGSGLSNMFSGGIGGALSGLGSILGVVGIIGGLIGAMKRNLKDQGIQGSFGPGGFSGEKWEYWGGNLLSGAKTKTHAMDPEMQAFMDETFSGIKDGVLELGAVLGLGEDALEGFSHSFKLSLHNMSSEEAQAAVEREMGEMAGEMAKTILGSDEWNKAGETSLEALERMAASLTTVNQAFELLGGQMMDASVEAGHLSSRMVDIVGDLASFTSAVNSYYQNFYSAQEQTAALTQQMTQELERFNVSLPNSRLEFRSLMESIDTTTVYGQELYATLLKISDAFAQITEPGVGFSKEFTQMFADLREDVRERMALASEIERLNRASARLWMTAADTLKQLQLAIRGDTEKTIGQSGTARLLQNLNTVFASAMSGDVSSVQDFATISRDYFNSLSTSTGSAIEFERASKMLQIKTNQLEAFTREQGTLEEQMANIARAQLDILTELYNFLSLDGIEISEFEDLDAFFDMMNTQLANFNTRLSEVGGDLFGVLSSSFEDLSGVLAEIEQELGVQSSEFIGALGELADELNIPLGDLLDEIALLGDDLSSPLETIFGAVSSLAGELGIPLGDVISSLAKLNLDLGVPLEGILTELDFLAADLGVPLFELVEGLGQLDSSVFDSAESMTAAIAELASQLGVDVESLNSGIGDLVTPLATIHEALSDGLLALADDLGISVATLLPALRGVSHDFGISIENLASDLKNSFVEAANRLGASVGRLSQGIVDALSSQNLRLDRTVEVLKTIRDRNTELLKDLGTMLRSIQAVLGEPLRSAVEELRRNPGKLKDIFEHLRLTVKMDEITLPLDGLNVKITGLQSALSSELEAIRAILLEQKAASVALVRIFALREQIDRAINTYGEEMVTPATIASSAKVGTGASWVRLSDGTYYESFEGNEDNEYRVVMKQANEYIAEQKRRYEGWLNTIIPLQDELAALTGANVPGFASGGQHTGGFRVVGENGPELEFTGPSSIYNNGETRKMLDNTKLVEEISKMRTESAAREQREAQFRRDLVRENERMRRVFKKWDVSGLPAERVS